MENRQYLDPLTQAVKGDVGCSADDQPTRILVGRQAADLRMPGKQGNCLDNTPDYLFGGHDIVEGDIGADVVEILEGFIQPDDFIHWG